MLAHLIRKRIPYTLLAMLCLLIPDAFKGQGEARPVRVAEASFAPLPISVELVGTINARNQAELSSQVEGLVEGLEVDVGSKVEAGDVLLTLDATLADIRRARTAEDIKAARAELADARRRLREISALGESGGVTESERQTRKAEVQIRETRVAGLELALREEEEILHRHTLRAPFSGTISERYAQVGEWILPAQARTGPSTTGRELIPYASGSPHSIGRHQRF